MSLNNIVLSMNATVTLQGRFPRMGRVDLLDTGDVRWELRGVDGGGRPLLTLDIHPHLIDKAVLSPAGSIPLVDGWVLTFGSRERAERFQSAVRNTSFARV